MPFQKQQQITQKLDTITQSFSRLTERLERAYTLIGDGYTLMRNLLDAVPCGVLIFDETFHLSYANQVAEELFGNLVNEVQAQSGESLASLEKAFTFCHLNPEHPNIICHLFAQVLNQEATYLPDVVLQKGEQTNFLEVWINPKVQVFDQRYRKTQQNTIMILLDISERKKIEQVLREEMKIQAEFKSADRILQALLPDQTPQLPNFEIAAHCIPASVIGGDFYDWYLKDDGQLIFSLGDVMGKEMSAALLMTTLRSALRTSFIQMELDVTLQQVGEALLNDFEQLNSFATVFHGRLEPTEKRLVFVNAGHTCGFILRADGTIDGLAEAQLPLGIPHQEPYQLHQYQFQKGDRLVLYTRGIIRSHKEDSVDEITRHLARSLENSNNAQEMVESLLQLTDERGADQDRTVLVLNCLT